MDNYAKLGPRLQRFVDLIVEGCTGAEAVHRIRPRHRRPKQEAYEWRRQPRVRAAIAERQAEVIAESGINLVRVLKETANVAFANLQELFDADGNLLPIEKWPEGAARAVVGLDFEAVMEGRGSNRKHVGDVVKIRTAPKVEALRLLGQYLKAWTETHEVTGKDGAPMPGTTQTVYIIQKDEAKRISEDLDGKV